MDVFRKCLEFAKRVDPMHSAGVYPYFRVISSPQDPIVVHQGQDLVMLGSNNYLGLTNHPAVKEAAAAALARYGTGCAGSRLLNGDYILHGLHVVKGAILIVVNWSWAAACCFPWPFRAHYFPSATGTRRKVMVRSQVLQLSVRWSMLSLLYGYMMG